MLLFTKLTKCDIIATISSGTMKLERLKGDFMKNLKVYENEKEMVNLIKFSRRENEKVSISEQMITSIPELFTVSEDTKKASAIYGLRVVTAPFVIGTAMVLHQIERVNKKKKLTSIMDCSKENIAYSEGDFNYRNGQPKTSIVGCVSDLNTKNVNKESLKEIRVIVKDLHMESLPEENYDRLNSLEFVGGNLYLSDNSIEAFKVKQLLPNLKYVGGNILVNAKEYQKVISR